MAAHISRIVPRIVRMSAPFPQALASTAERSLPRAVGAAIAFGGVLSEPTCRFGVRTLAAEATAAVAAPGCMVKCDYRGTLEDGTEFDSSQGRGPLEFELGAGQMIPGFDAAVHGKEASCAVARVWPETKKKS